MKLKKKEDLKMKGIKFQLKRETVKDGPSLPSNQYAFCFSIIIEDSNSEEKTIVPLEFNFEHRLLEDVALILSKHVFQFLTVGDIVEQFGEISGELINMMITHTDIFLVPRCKESVKKLTDNMKKYVENGLKNCMKKNSENPWLESELVIDLDV
jgi:hypothetical protein